MWYLAGTAAILIFFLAVLYLIYYMAFQRNKMTILDDRTLPEGEQYEPHNESILKSIERMLPEPFEEVKIKARDGIKLYARLYQMYDDVPVILFFHGYRSSSIRDGNGIFELCKKHGYNIMMIDQRAHGKSEGKTITFGICERYDVLSWVSYAVEHFGKNTRIVLAGISMGASTVLMASNLNLPKNVKGIMADCPYSSPKDILNCVMKSLKLPARLLYLLAKWSAKIYGRVDIEETSAKEAVTEAKVPILFIHGDDDRFVPCFMSEECCEACASDKKLVFVKNAGHGISYCVDAKLYEKEVTEFMKRVCQADDID